MSKTSSIILSFNGFGTDSFHTGSSSRISMNFSSGIFPSLYRTEIRFPKNHTNTAPVFHPLPGQTCQILASSPRAGWWSSTRPRRWSGWWRALCPAGADSGTSLGRCRRSLQRLSSVLASLLWSGPWSDSSSRRQRRKFSAVRRRRGQSLQTACAAESLCDVTEEQCLRCLKWSRGLSYESRTFL